MRVCFLFLMFVIAASAAPLEPELKQDMTHEKQIFGHGLGHGLGLGRGLYGPGGYGGSTNDNKQVVYVNNGQSQGPGIGYGGAPLYGGGLGGVGLGGLGGYGGSGSSASSSSTSSNYGGFGGLGGLGSSGANSQSSSYSLGK